VKLVSTTLLLLPPSRLSITCTHIHDLPAGTHCLYQSLVDYFIQRLQISTKNIPVLHLPLNKR